MLTLLKRFFGSSSNSSQMEADVAEAASQLDIQMAIAAHENWRLRLLAYLEGTSKENFSPEVICFDDRCDLGKWIHGAGKARLGAFPGFTALMGHHKMFHYAASNVVSLAMAGKQTEAQKILTGQFDNFSKSVVLDLKALLEIVERSKKGKRA